jgi:hypothetical protein
MHNNGTCIPAKYLPTIIIKPFFLLKFLTEKMVLRKIIVGCIIPQLNLSDV